MSHRWRIGGIAVALLAVVGQGSRAQALRVGPGSTPAGDALRGAGVAAFGIGVGDYYEAAANRVNVESFIRLNDYAAAVLKQENRENRRIAQAARRQDRENWNALQARLENDPNLGDVNKGDALNAKAKQLLALGSGLRYSRTVLPADTIRRLPLVLKHKGLVFSMQRMALKSPKQWPVAFQDPKFATQRRDYVRAFERALDQIEGKQTLGAIGDVEAALRALRTQLDRVFGPAQRSQEQKTLYNEARNHLARLDRLTEVLKDHQMQRILVEIEQYSGTTLFDLIEFLNRNQLQFAVADPGDERTTVRKLYLLMADELKAVAPGPTK